MVALIAVASTRFRSHHRIASFLAGVAALAKDRRALRGVALWTIGMQVFRLAGTLAVVYAFGLPHPLLAALVILPALDLAGTIPLTPGQFRHRRRRRRGRPREPRDRDDGRTR